jgi:hypothetical protein
MPLKQQHPLIEDREFRDKGLTWEDVMNICIVWSFLSCVILGALAVYVMKGIR